MGKIKITISNAENLKPMDLNGSSGKRFFYNFLDPYVIVNTTFGNLKKSFQTKTIKKNLNPKWNETFEISGVSHQDLEKSTIVLKLYDFDIGLDDVLG